MKLNQTVPHLQLHLTAATLLLFLVFVSFLQCCAALGSTSKPKGHDAIYSLVLKKKIYPS